MPLVPLVLGVHGGWPWVARDYLATTAYATPCEKVFVQSSKDLLETGRTYPDLGGSGTEIRLGSTS